MVLYKFELHTHKKMYECVFLISFLPLHQHGRLAEEMPSITLFFPKFLLHPYPVSSFTRSLTVDSIDEIINIRDGAA